MIYIYEYLSNYPTDLNLFSQAVVDITYGHIRAARLQMVLSPYNLSWVRVHRGEAARSFYQKLDRDLSLWLVTQEIPAGFEDTDLAHRWSQPLSNANRPQPWSSQGSLLRLRNLLEVCARLEILLSQRVPEQRSKPWGVKIVQQVTMVDDGW